LFDRGIESAIERARPQELHARIELVAQKPKAAAEVAIGDGFRLDLRLRAPLVVLVGELLGARFELLPALSRGLAQLVERVGHVISLPNSDANT
jgi:hypothetical protein